MFGFEEDFMYFLLKLKFVFNLPTVFYKGTTMIETTEVSLRWDNDLAKIVFIFIIIFTICIAARL